MLHRLLHRHPKSAITTCSEISDDNAIFLGLELSSPGTVSSGGSRMKFDGYSSLTGSEHFRLLRPGRRMGFCHFDDFLGHIGIVQII